MLSWYYKIKAALNRSSRLNRSTTLQFGDSMGNGEGAQVFAVLKETSAEGNTLAEITHTMNREDLLCIYNAIGRRVSELFKNDHDLRRHVDGTLFAFDSSGRAKGLG